MGKKKRDWRPPRRSFKLAELDLSASLKHKEYEARLYDLQVAMVELQRKVVDNGLRLALVFEGMDAGGKGGAIKRLTQFLDPRGADVHAIGAPNEQERGHHYLRRFWLRLPSRGRIAIFDRSWYGRMLVEPIEGFCTPAEYERAPREIREFECLLADDGYCIIKFWLHVDKDEQLRRFKEREDDPLKEWKITAEDWRNREKYDDYVRHAEHMFATTDVPRAPWHLIPGNDKHSSRIEVLDTVVSCLEEIPAG